MRTYRRTTSKQFRKDLRRLRKSGLELSELGRVIDILASGKTLPPTYLDHGLHGTLHGFRECHIAPDWLLLYARDDEKLILLLVRTGSHRDVLGIE